MHQPVAVSFRPVIVTMSSAPLSRDPLHLVTLGTADALLILINTGSPRLTSGRYKPCFLRLKAFVGGS